MKKNKMEDISQDGFIERWETVAATSRVLCYVRVDKSSYTKKMSFYDNLTPSFFQKISLEGFESIYPFTANDILCTCGRATEIVFIVQFEYIASQIFSVII